MSLFQVGDYTESLELSIKCLNLTNQVKENINEINVALLIEFNLQKLTNEQRESALNKVKTSQNNDFIKKFVLCEFAWFYYFYKIDY